MASGPFQQARETDRGFWLAGALWRRRAAILLSTAASAGTALGLCSLLLPVQPATRIILMDRGSVSAGPVAGSLGELAVTAGNALASGFKASADLMSGRDPDRPAVARLAEILHSAPAGSGELLTDARMGEFARAARDVLASGPREATAPMPRVLADLALPGESAAASPALPAAALAGLAGLLAASVHAAASELKARRRRLAGNRWDEPKLAGRSAARGATALPPRIEPSPIEPEFGEGNATDGRQEVQLDAGEIETIAAMAPPAIVPEGIGSVAVAIVEPELSPAGDENRPDPASAPRLIETGDKLPEADILELPRSAPVLLSMEAEDIADVALADGLRTMLVVEAGEGARSCASVDLVRALALRGKASILLDLGFDRVLASDLGIEETAPGLSDFLTGTATIAAVLHRDAAGSADAIVWGRDGMAAPIQAERLGELFATLAEVYDCVVVAGGPMSLRGLTGLLGDGSAAIVSMSPGADETAEKRMSELSDCGGRQALLMSAYPRNLHLIARAA
ncbi:MULTISPECIES: hypothetical protein [unclassified Aureimonas]|uniref:hypothetical protein n=1 Tax=unclassified Aureimonas TaxID=2615206 RepID=UPI0006F7773E|nr:MULTISPECIES: hypothetical protein [unclassified Aureimonas]KQT52988.1 hypothetical protein ASG62_13870 [Aureimonas sp. Leaf427]KQT80445.1 hypothetical protein ASG54_07720 [Aureimonas sp. Leaf460]